MMITKTALPRRTFLRGIGASLTLPLLDAMVPALTPIAKTAAAPIPRLGWIYVPNGFIKSPWIPAKAGREFELTPSLQALAPFRDRLVVLTGLADPAALQRVGDLNGPHSRAVTAWLTAAHAKPTEGADVQAGTSVDQIAATILGRQTPLPSLELGIERNEKATGACEGGYSCVYGNTICWRTPTTPLPMENQPRVVFERLFGDGDSHADRLAQMRRTRSILDEVTEDLESLKARLGINDRGRLTEYLDSVREIETRIQRVENGKDASELDLPERPTETPGSFEDHVKLMLDLMAVAYQTDSTRVATFQWGYEQTNRGYPHLGVPESHHGLSHHQEEEDKKTKKAKIDAYHVSLLAYFGEKLRNIQDGDGTLLDHIMLVYGSGLGEPNLHEPFDLPTLLLGGGCGRIKGGRHLRFPAEEMIPMSNLYVTLLDYAGAPIEAFGDSTGNIEALAV